MENLSGVQWQHNFYWSCFLSKRHFFFPCFTAPSYVVYKLYSIQDARLPGDCMSYLCSAINSLLLKPA